VFLSPPTGAIANLPFFLPVGSDLRNLGPLATVDGDVTLTLSVPSDCTATTPLSMVLGNTPLPFSMNVFVSGAWTVTCAQQGSHTFGVTSSVKPSSAGVTDTNPANDSSSNSSTFNVN
jgi:hypothetical protein